MKKENTKRLQDEQIKSYFEEKYGINFRKYFSTKSNKEITADEFSFLDSTLNKFQKTFQFSLKEKTQKINLEILYTNKGSGLGQWLGSFDKYRTTQNITLQSFTRKSKWAFYENRRQYQEAILVYELANWVKYNSTLKDTIFSDIEKECINKIGDLVQKNVEHQNLDSHLKKEFLPPILTSYYWLINYKSDKEKEADMDLFSITNSSKHLELMIELVIQLKKNFVYYNGIIENRFDYEKRESLAAKKAEEYF